MNPLELAPERVDRDIGLRGRFRDFVEVAWPHVDPSPFVDGWHIGVISEALEAVQAGQLRKLVINIPPGCMKSLLVCVLWPVWCWVRDPTDSFLASSFDAGLTRRDAGKSLALVQSEWFRRRWGDRVSCAPEAAAGDYANSAGGWRFATSTGGKATGRHPRRRIIDDPTKPQTVSEATLQDAEHYWRNTLASRQQDATKVSTVLVMQRLAVGDLAGIFEAEGGWEILRLPMRYEPERAYSKDPRTQAGELLWPARFPEAETRELERNLGSRVAAAQLQQRPFPEGGTIIKREWIRWYNPKDVPRFSTKIQTWDLTFKDTKKADHVAGQVWGVDEANFYLIDGILERLDFVATCGAILGMSAEHPDAIGILVEDKANGPAVMSMLEDKVSGLVPVEPLGGKGARLNAVAPLFEAGNVWLPIGHPVAELLALHLQAFPNGDVDDDVDACTQVLNHLHGQVLDYEAAMRGLKSF